MSFFQSKNLSTTLYFETLKFVDPLFLGLKKLCGLQFFSSWLRPCSYMGQLCPFHPHIIVFMDSGSWISYGQMDLRDVPENCYGHSAMKWLVKSSQRHSEMKSICTICCMLFKRNRCGIILDENISKNIIYVYETAFKISNELFSETAVLT